MLGPSSTTNIKRLTPEQLAHVFKAPKKKDTLKEGLYNERGAKILKDQIEKEKKRNTKRLYSKTELRKLKKLQEEKNQMRKRNLMEDYWYALWNINQPAAGASPGEQGGDTGVIGNFLIGLDFEIGK